MAVRVNPRRRERQEDLVMKSRAGVFDDEYGIDAAPAKQCRHITGECVEHLNRDAWRSEQAEPWLEKAERWTGGETCPRQSFREVREPIRDTSTVSGARRRPFSS